MKTLLKLSFSVLFGIVLLEVALRIYNPIPFTVKREKIVLPANKTYTFENTHHPKLDPVITSRRNSLGFRGDEPPPNFSDLLTIVAVGGSTTACDYLSEGKTWSDQLAQKLKQKIPQVWVNNAGLDGHSTFAHSLLLKDYIVQLKPKVIIFLVGINDVEIVKQQSFDDQMLKGKFDFRTLRSFAFSLSRNSEVISTGINLYRASLATKRNVGHFALELNEIPQIEVTEAEAQSIINNNKKTFLPGYRQRLEKLITLCKDNGISPIFLTQPALYGVGTDEVTGTDLERIQIMEGRNGKVMWNLLELYNEELRTLGSEQNVPVVDLANQLPKSSLYFYDFYHFTNEGAEKTASILFPLLLDYLQGGGS